MSIESLVDVSDIGGAIRGYASVSRWVEEYGLLWTRKQSDAEVNCRLQVLSRYCSFCGTDPDELLRGLFRETPSGPRIRLKRRREVMSEIDAFERVMGNGDERGGREIGNIVRSFLIHNGVALSPTPLR